MTRSILLRKAVPNKNDIFWYNVHESLINSQCLEVAAMSECRYRCKKTDFKVKCFSETLEIGSKSLLVKKTRKFPKSHSGTNLFSGGLVLKTPFKRRIMSGCWPTAIPSTGGRIADNMDLYPEIVLYFRPDWNKDERKSAHWAIEAECGLISLTLHQLLNLRNFAE